MWLSFIGILLQVIKEKIKYSVAHHFGVDPSKIYLTSPTFFSEMTPRKAVTIHDEYWHPHVDKVCINTFIIIRLINHVINNNIIKVKLVHRIWL